MWPLLRIVVPYKQTTKEGGHVDTVNQSVLGDCLQVDDTGEVGLDLNEVCRRLLEQCLNAVMSEQADELLGEGNRRNGYRERKLRTCVGTITLRIPKLREGSYFPTDILKPYSRTDRALIGIIKEIYVLGLSHRKIEKAAIDLEFGSLSSSAISRMCASLDEEVTDLCEKRFEGDFPYLWLDATYLKCRDEGRVKTKAVVTAIALCPDGSRRFVGLDVVDTESYVSWKDFLRDLRKRGIQGVRCVVSDDHAGLVRAAQETWADVSWQRCIVHLERDVLSRFRRTNDKKRAAKALKAVFAERDPRLVREMYAQAIEKIGALEKRAGDLLEDARDDALTYLDFYYEHHVRLRTNNVQERANREIKRRARVVQTFPSPESLIRLIGAVCTEMNETWMNMRFMDVDDKKLWGIKTTQVQPCTEEIQKKASLLLDTAMREAA